MNKSKFIAIISTIILTSMFVLGFAFTIAKSGKTEKVTFYLLTNGKESDKNKAIVSAVTVKSRGGAGYLYSAGGKNYVVLCCYSEKDDAYSIAKRIQNSQVIELNILISQDFQCAATQKLGIEISNQLYDLSVDFDLGKIDAKTLKMTLGKIQERLDDKVKNFGAKDKITLTKLLEFSDIIENLLTCNESFLDWNLKHQRVKILDYCLLK